MLEQIYQIASNAVSAPDFWMFFAIGLIAQLFDGALGMGFGVISSTTLAALGFPRAAVSGAANGAKIFTGLFSGAAHIYYRNIDWPLFGRLVTGGLIGAIPGAFLVANADGLWFGLLMSAYLILIGIIIIRQSYKPHHQHTTPARTFGVGIAGGFLEAISGVWGPLVTSTMVAMGAMPRKVIGSTNLAEFVVAILVFAILVLHVELATIGNSVIALALGAFVAAPIAAKLTTEIPRRALMISVGILVIVTSLIRAARDIAPLLG